MTYPFVMNVTADEVEYTASGPLGKFTVSGSRADGFKVRAEAMYLVGYRIEP
jgi:hypothetical protein